jgi:hypothetical protein
MAKITVLEQKTFEGKPSGFKVTLDDGTNGNLQEKESDKGLRVGDDVIVTLIPYTSKKGVTSNLLGLRLANTTGTTVAQRPTPTPTPQPQQGAVKPPNTSAISAAKSISEMKFEGRVVCMKLAVECLLQGKFEKAEAIEAFAEWVTVLDASIDELKSK